MEEVNVPVKQVDAPVKQVQQPVPAPQPQPAPPQQDNLIGPVIVLKDLNGDHYLGPQEGELLHEVKDNRIIFAPTTPRAYEPYQRCDFTGPQVKDFLLANCRYLRASIVNGQPKFTVQQAAIISYHRMLVVQHGLVSPEFNPATFYVDYTEAREIDNPAVALLPEVTIEEITNVLTKKIVTDINKTFTDRVSMVAFVFRARGHHYTDDYQELYERVWRKCRYDSSMLHISFQHLATAAFHAIFPIILDRFWVDEVALQHVNGALQKRLDVAPAGSAGPYVLQQGVLDLLMIAPGIRKRLEEALTYLDEFIDQLKEHRFNGSVNARYYNAKRNRFDEKKVAAIAATIKAAIDNLTDDAPLGKSPALLRIANNAPITGAILGRAIGNIAQSPHVTDVLLLTEE